MTANQLIDLVRLATLLAAAVLIAWTVKKLPNLGPRFWFFIDGLIIRGSQINMTNLRQQVTLILVLGTGFVYLGLAIKYALVPESRQWTPDLQWLGFLCIMSGLDMTQYFTKRATDATFVAAKAGAAPAAGRPSGAMAAPPTGDQ